MRFVRFACPAALLALIAGSAFAGTTATAGVSPLAISTIDYSPMVSTVVTAGTPAEPSAVLAENSEYRGDRRRPYDDDPYRNDAIRYRDRGYRRRGSYTDDQTQIAGEPFQQGGTTVTPTRVLSRASTNLFPFTLFMQVQGDENQSVIPYGGIAGGWEVLFLSADDFTTGDSFDATFTGWGWQAWLGAGIPLSGQARLNGEVYVNQAEPERDVDDAATGLTFRERVKADGVGMRLGLQFGF